ncbi:hypothetical protein EC991_000501 [Linnemannia zychae]|nr:hypothetical protein EC991_000501 [Linnemannia zychae]
MQVLSTFSHPPNTRSTYFPSDLLTAIQQCVQRSAQGIQSIVGNIPLRKIAKVIYYACMVVGFATFATAATSSLVLSVPIAQIAVFVAQHVGTMALAPLIENIIVAVSVSGITGVMIELAWTKHQLVKLVGLNNTMIEERNTMAAERDAISIVRDLVVIERDNVTALMETAVAQRDTAIAGRDAAVIERDAAIDERDTSIIENTSLTARVTALEDEMRQLATRINASLLSPNVVPIADLAPVSPAPSVQNE